MKAEGPHSMAYVAALTSSFTVARQLSPASVIGGLNQPSRAVRGTMQTHTRPQGRRSVARPSSLHAKMKPTRRAFTTVFESRGGGGPRPISTSQKDPLQSGSVHRDPWA